MRRIFLSHASEDKLIADDLVTLLQMGGFPRECIFCTSMKDGVIPPGTHFVEWIRQELVGEPIMIVLLTPHYYESVFCLCELGASWVMSHSLCPLLVPPVKPADVSDVLQGTQTLRIDEPSHLNQLYQKLCAELDIDSNFTVWEENRNKFLKKLGEKLAKTRPPKKIPIAEHELIVNDFRQRITGSKRRNRIIVGLFVLLLVIVGLGYVPATVDLEVIPQNASVSVDGKQLALDENGKIQISHSRNGSVQIVADAPGFNSLEIRHVHGDANNGTRVIRLTRELKNDTLVNSIEMRFKLVQVPPSSQADVQSPSKSYYISETEVTQRQYEAVTGENRSEFKAGQGQTGELPADSISWFDAAKVCDRLNELEGLPARYDLTTNPPKIRRGSTGYHIPTDVQWTYAYRGGLSANQGDAKPMPLAWVKERGITRPQAVGTSQLNRIGIFDMHGNVWEWIEERYGRDPNPEDGVVRGGSWAAPAELAGAAESDRFSQPKLERKRQAPGDLGFRVVLEIK